MQSVDGVAGSLSAQRDWFYFVNGYEADRSAADYRLHPGDVEWWDYRTLAAAGASVPVVVGAFPEPFLHGYGGKRGRLVVVTAVAPQDARLGVSSVDAWAGPERRCPPARTAPSSGRGRDALRRASLAGRPVRMTSAATAAGSCAAAPAPLPVRGRMRPAAAARCSPALAAAALLAQRTLSVAVITAVLLALCLRAPAGRARPYLVRHARLRASPSSS